MPNTQTVIIDFQADFSSVQDAVDILEKTGKVDAGLAATFRKTNSEIQKQGQALKTTAQSGTASTQSFTKLSQLMQQFPKTGMNRFLLQVGNELTAAGIKADDFFTKTKTKPVETTTAFTSLRQELKNVKEQMQQAALSGGVLSEEYKKLKERAGQLDDTIKDVSQDIRNAGSDTRGIDNVVGSISALAGGFSAVQGATALFGDESEDLQKALLKVNAAMALSTGLQQVSNALTKQGSLYRLAETAATYGQAAAQRLYAIVVGQSVGIMKVFRIALASTGIGLLVIGLTALISKMGGASKATKQLKKDLEDLRAGTDIAREAIQQEGELAVTLLEERGVAQSKISKQRLTQLENERSAEEAGLLQLEATRTKLKEQLKSRDVSILTSTIKGLKLVEEQTVTSEKNIRDITRQLQIDKIKARTQESEERKKDEEKRVEDAKAANEKLKELNERQREEAARQRALQFEDFKAGVELELLAAEEGSEEQLRLQKKLLQAKLLIDLEGENITFNQRKLLIQQFFKERLELEKKFSKAIVASAIEDEKNRLDAELQNLNLAEEDKLSARIEFMRLTSAQEITEAEGNASKIKAINAKLNADISALKIESIRKTANDELALSSAQGGVAKRALDSVAANEKMKTGVRINAIRQLSQIETSAIDRQIKANRDAAMIQGADQKALAIEYEQLLDNKAAAAEATEKKITDLIEAENEKRQASDIAYIQTTIAGLQSLADIAAGMQANQAERAANELEIQRRRIDELLEAGVITENEAKKRNKRLDAEERATKQKAAQQQKNLAVFQAVLQIPQAYIAGLTAPFPIGGPIYASILAGLAAVQAGIIASRPIPRFYRGKKDKYEGPAEVAEFGAELIQREDGRMEVATGKQIVYLKSRDKVFTHTETKEILRANKEKVVHLPAQSKTYNYFSTNNVTNSEPQVKSFTRYETKIIQPTVNKEVIRESGKVAGIDYNKMAAAIGKHKVKPSETNINIDKDFISESVSNGLSRVNYWSRYYSSK